MGRTSIRIGVFKPDAEAMFIEVRETLDTLQKIVGGYIEMFSISTDGLIATCNEEGKLLGLPFNRYIGGSHGATDELVGTFLVSRGNGNGDLASLTPDDEDRLTVWTPHTIWNVRTY